jgi:hypothetical protein
MHGLFLLSSLWNELPVTVHIGDRPTVHRGPRNRDARRILLQAKRFEIELLIGYEGHTSYRVDPIAIVGGLRSIEEIEAAFPGRLYKTLTGHFTAPRDSQKPHVTVTDRHAGSNPVSVCPTLEGNV